MEISRRPVRLMFRLRVVQSRLAIVSVCRDLKLAGVSGQRESRVQAANGLLCFARAVLVKELSDCVQ